MKHFSVIIGMMVFSLIFLFHDAKASTSDLRLIAREESPVINDIFSDSQWRWLGNKKDLILGTAFPDYPPYEMTTSGLGLEGVTPDVVGVLARIMGLNVIVRRFDSYEAAKEALSQGGIDVLGTTEADTLDARFILTLPYVPDKPVMVTRDSVSSPEHNVGRLAVVRDYRSIAALQVAFPVYRIVTYNTFADAAAAVAYGQADMLVGDAMSANYLINKSYFNELRILPASQLKTQGYAFAMASSNQQFLTIFNQAIESLSRRVLDSICHRWSYGGLPTFDYEALQLDTAELDWKLAHGNVVPISVNGLLAPISYYDTKNNFRGMAADILDIVQLKTGLRFVPVRADSISEMVKQVNDEKVLAAAAVTRYGYGKDILSFTIPYFSDGLVLVADKHERAITGLEAMGKRTLAIIRGTDLAKRLPAGAHLLNIVEVENSTLAMDQMIRGRIDGLLQSKVVSTYYVNRFFADKLRIVSGVDGETVNFSIAVSKAEPELLSILNKALLSIPPQELSVLANRWSGPPEASTGSWESARGTVLRISALALVGLLIGGGWIGYLRRQIHLRIDAEKSLNYQLQLIKTLLDGTPHPIYAVDAYGHLLLANKAYALFFGFADVYPGQSLLREMATHNQQAVNTFEELIAQVLSSEHWVKGDIEVQGQVSPYYFNHWLLPFYDQRNKVAGAIGGWMDISQQKALMVDLKAQKELADQASRSKSDFLTTMSHEIRTPLNVVIGMLELALGEEGSQFIDRTYIEVAYDSSRSLLSILGDTLDLAKIESGRLEIRKEPYDIKSLLQNVVVTFQGLARKKELTLDLDFGSPLDKDVLIDPVRLRQVLYNLIGNSIKFTQQGGVTVQVWLDRQEGDRVMLNIVIGDSGPGISDADQQKLFTPFSQVTGQPRVPGSSGLGLSICKSLMHLMGGELQLTSVLGQGTHIHLLLKVQTLKKTQVLESDQSTASPPPADSLAILIVDDHPPNRLLLGQQLKTLGHLVAEAVGAKHALELTEVQPFDLIFTDCNMPDMSGYSLARRIRAQPGHVWDEVFIYGYTANAQPEVAQLCVEAGMDGCLFKPLSLDGLSVVIADILKERRLRDLAVVKVDNILQLCGGQADLAANLVEELIRTNSTDVIALQDAITRSNFVLAAAVVHRIKSAARIVSAGKLFTACAQYEAYVDKAEGTVELLGLADAIEEQVAVLHRALSRLFPFVDQVDY
ncbi:ATP-binding protein [Pseudomonas koreensis]|uniref:ATP-binding protein n=1 Tax=Pseudomonas koreensis TaxID=198620 RepID=UPI003F83D021